MITYLHLFLTPYSFVLSSTFIPMNDNSIFTCFSFAYFHDEEIFNVEGIDIFTSI